MSKDNANRPNEAKPRTGEQSQDALRHQQDAAHHKGHKTAQGGTAENEPDPLPKDPSRAP